MMSRKPRARDQPNQAYCRHPKNLKARDDEKQQEPKRLQTKLSRKKER